MKTRDLNLKRTLIKIVAVLQIVIGGLLMVGTIGLTQTAYQTVRDESRQLTDNLSAAADALESWRATYAESATNLFGFTGTINDVSAKLGGVSEKVFRMGELFTKLRLKGTGEKWKDVGIDIASISETLKRQGEAIEGYRDDGHEKALLAMSKTVESLRHTIRRIDGGRSAGRWCGFVCILGFCVSMLFFTNGALLLIVNRLGSKDSRTVLEETGLTKMIPSDD